MRTSYGLSLSVMLSRYKAHLNDLIMYKIAVSAFNSFGSGFSPDMVGYLPLTKRCAQGYISHHEDLSRATGDLNPNSNLFLRPLRVYLFLHRMILKLCLLYFLAAEPTFLSAYSFTRRAVLWVCRVLDHYPRLVYISRGPVDLSLFNLR